MIISGTIIKVVGKDCHVKQYNTGMVYKTNIKNVKVENPKYPKEIVVDFMKANFLCYSGNK